MTKDLQSVRLGPTLRPGNAIANACGREVWDSRGYPTVEAQITLVNGVIGRGIAPGGISVGANEAKSLRDGGHRLMGLGVARAVQSIDNAISSELAGLNPRDQAEVDARLQKAAPIGSNLRLAVSIAVAQAAAADAKQPLFFHLGGSGAVTLPVPEVQIFGGGAHAPGTTQLQEIMVLCPGASSFREALEWSAEIYHRVREDLNRRGWLRGLADQGGFWPAFSDAKHGLDITSDAIHAAGFKPEDVGMSLDFAASELRHGTGYFSRNADELLDGDEHYEFLCSWLNAYNIISVEDPFSDDDIPSFIRLTSEYGDQLQIVGDDLFATDTGLLTSGARSGAANAIMLKPAQRGTLSETLVARSAAADQGYMAIIAGRSGDTEDVSIMHLAVGWQVPQLKVGGFGRSERMAKWNEGLRIEATLGSSAKFSGREALKGAQKRTVALEAGDGDEP